MEWIRNQGHMKTIIHIEIDCFYAQVELLRRSHLQNEPVGVKQKNVVVTCNHAARRCGIKKYMLVTEALQICPGLLLFSGEDLYNYHQASNQIHLFLLSFTDKVEKSGLDENYLDVTELVKETECNNRYSPGVTGHCIGELNNICACGCHKRLSIASQIAYDIRTKLKNKLGFTSCSGVSINKLLAKVSCSAHKPNQQTVLLPNGTLEFLQSLNKVEKLPGVGEKIKQMLELVNVRTVKELQEVSLKSLKKVLKSEETAVRLRNVSLGLCDSDVKQSGKPNSVSLEDGFRKISVESDVKEKFKILLQRLMILVRDDGRIPMTVNVTVRKHDSERKVSYRETKQSPVPTSLFLYTVAGKLSDESSNKLLSIIMGLFWKMVNMSKPFHITLLGLGFCKFHEKLDSRSVASYMLKKQDLSVQSLTSFVSNKTSAEVVTDTVPACGKSESDSETEPSPKKTKLDVISKKINISSDVEMCSPSKLKVENLNINGDVDFARGFPPCVDTKRVQRTDKGLLGRNHCKNDLKKA